MSSSQMPNAAAGLTRSLLLSVGCALALLGFSWHTPAVSLRQDDLGYLAWALQAGGDALAWLRGPEWLSYWRPLNAATWWAAARLGPDGALTRAALAALWTGAVVVLAGAAGRRTGWRQGAVAALGLLGASVFVDLLGWRSWLTTTGTLFGLSVGVGALSAARPSVVGVLVAGLFALGFKETGAFALGALAVLHGPRAVRLVGGGLVLAALASAAGSSHKLALASLPGNGMFHLESLGLFAWALPVLLASRWPGVARPLLVVSAGAVLLPLPLAGALTAAGVVAALWGAWPWLLAAGAALVPPLLGAATSRQYVLESWTLVVAGLALARPLGVRPWVLALSALAAAPQALDFARGREQVREDWVEQRAFFQTFHPEPARALYHPDPMYGYDLDMLVWLSLGATWQGAPPAGSAPLQVGPRSGVWADLAPAQSGTGSNTTDPL